MLIMSQSNIDDYNVTEAAKTATEKLDDLFKSLDWRLAAIEEKLNGNG